MKNNNKPIKISELVFKPHTTNEIPKDLQVGDLVAYRISRINKCGTEEIINHIPYSASFLNWSETPANWKIKEYAVIECAKKLAEQLYQLAKYQAGLESIRPSA